MVTARVMPKGFRWALGLSRSMMPTAIRGITKLAAITHRCRLVKDRDRTQWYRATAVEIAGKQLVSRKLTGSRGPGITFRASSTVKIQPVHTETTQRAARVSTGIQQ